MIEIPNFQDVGIWPGTTQNPSGSVQLKLIDRYAIHN